MAARKAEMTLGSEGLASRATSLGGGERLLPILFRLLKRWIERDRAVELCQRLGILALPQQQLAEYVVDLGILRIHGDQFAEQILRLTKLPCPDQRARQIEARVFII